MNIFKPESFEEVSINIEAESSAEEKKGLWTHTNVLKTKVDCFPQPELLDLLISL